MHTFCAELRKDKRQRAVGSVTPGANNGAYNAAAHRGRSDSAGPPAMPAASAAAAPPPAPRATSGSGAAPINPARQPFVPRVMNTGPPEDPGPPPPQLAPGREIRPAVHVPPQPPAAGAYSSGTEQDDSGVENAGVNSRADMMDRILEEEDELIQCHRKDIEETMNTVRSEMNLLAEVDQPGSAIDTYVVKLKEILEKKEKAIQALWEKVTSFERQLHEEEMFSRSMAPSR